MTVTYNTVMQFVVNSNRDMLWNVNICKEYCKEFTRITHLWNQPTYPNQARSPHHYLALFSTYSWARPPPNEIGYYMCNVVSHWLRPCSAKCRKRTPLSQHRLIKGVLYHTEDRLVGTPSSISCMCRSPVNSPEKASDAELWGFLWSAPEQTVKTVLIRHRAHYDVTVMFTGNGGYHCSQPSLSAEIESSVLQTHQWTALVGFYIRTEFWYSVISFLPHYMFDRSITFDYFISSMTMATT